MKSAFILIVGTDTVATIQDVPGADLQHKCEEALTDYHACKVYVDGINEEHNSLLISYRTEIDGQTEARTSELFKTNLY
jgi:hypothetical protein